MLRAVRKDATPDEVAAETGMPLFRVRSALRELVEAGFVSKDGERFRQTEQGAAKEQSSDR
jgi:DNA-binding IclR family transcriptional regulator